MPVTFTYGTTYIDISGNHFTGTSIGTGNTSTRMYFADATFTTGEHNGRCFTIYTGTGNSTKNIYYILDTGTNYLDILGSFEATPDNTSGIRIWANMTDLYNSSANTSNGYPITLEANGSYTVFKVTDLFIRIASSTLFCNINNIEFKITSTKTYCIYLNGSGAGFSSGFGVNALNKFYNKKLFIDVKVSSYTPSDFRLINKNATNLTYYTYFFNTDLSGYYKTALFNVDVSSSSAYTILLNCNISSNSIVLLATANGNIKNCVFENIRYIAQIGTYQPIIDSCNFNFTEDLNFYLFQITSSGVNATFSNLILQNILYNSQFAIFVSSSSGGANYLIINNLTLPSSITLATDFFTLNKDDDYCKINTTITKCFKDEDEDVIVGATVDLICEDDDTLSIYGLETDSNGCITPQNLQYAYVIRTSGTTTLTLTPNWKIQVSKTGFNTYIERFDINGSPITSATALNYIDAEPPVFVGDAGILTLVDTELGNKITATCNSATDAKSNPVFYSLYMQVDDFNNLFDSLNRKIIAPTNTITLEYAFDYNKTYYFGIRARDAVGNEDTNTEYLSITNIIGMYKVLSDKMDSIKSDTISIENKVDIIDTNLDSAKLTVEDTNTTIKIYDNYKADVSALALETTAQSISGKADKIQKNTKLIPTLI